MSTTTLAPAVANSATACHSPGAELNARFNQRIDAELKLCELERAVERLAERIDLAMAEPVLPPPRRSRRSAWWPSL